MEIKYQFHQINRLKFKASREIYLTERNQSGRVHYVDAYQLMLRIIFMLRVRICLKSFYWFYH